MRLTPALFKQAAPAAKIPEWRRAQRANRVFDGKLTHLTSEKLCDDVLQLLKPSLPPPNTCDIIDLYPGPCLWSQKLNDIVQPRRHVLVEPQFDVFSASIKPLLRQPGSTYRYAPDIKSALDVRGNLLSQETYHFGEKHHGSVAKDIGRDGETPKTNLNSDSTVNENLLVTANLSGIARKLQGFAGSQAKQFLYDYYHGILAGGTYLHQYGLVRLIAWVAEDSTITFMPTTVNSRTKHSVQLEASCTINTVAAPPQYLTMHPHQRRFYEIDVENRRIVRDRQKKLGLHIPPERKQPEFVPPFTALEPNADTIRKNKDLYPFNKVFLKKFLELDDTLSANYPDWYDRYKAEANDRFQDRSIYKPHQGNDPAKKEYRLLMTQLRTHHNTYLKAKDLIFERRQLFKQIYELWHRCLSLPSAGSSEDSAAVEKLGKLFGDDEFLYDQLQNIKTDTRGLITKACDDYRCLDSVPQTLAWNQRQHEPLLVHDNEFFPNKPLTLFDFKPKPEFPVRIDSIDKQICFDYVCATLTTYRSDSVMEGIKRLVPAGYDQFIESIPELRDVTKGGWHNLDRVGVRAMHTDLYIAIALAFLEWPHRPSIEKLMFSYQTVYDTGPR